LRTILTTRQVAEELGVSLITVYSYIREGTLKAYKLGGYSKRRHWRIKVVDLESFIIGRGAEQVSGESKLIPKSKVAMHPDAVSAPQSIEEK